MVWFLSVIIVLGSITIGWGGGPISKSFYPPLPPITYLQPRAPIPIPPPPPVIQGYGGLFIYMSDYKAVLSQAGQPKLNFGEVFGWSTREAITELTVGARVWGVAEGDFTWILPTTRSGTGPPLAPLSIGGYIFGPRPVDTILLKTRLTGERFTITAPLLGDRRFMPSGMLEWWHLNVHINGTPQVATTSSPAIETKQDFHKLLMGLGMAGEAGRRPLAINYRALYTLGGQTHGYLFQADVGYQQANLAAAIGYRFNTRTININTGDLCIDTNGPYATLKYFF